MEEIKVGEYIRTIEPYGEIFKVIGIGKEEVLVVDTYENSLVATGYVKKHSPNIIDVIEVGDYVNGYRVDKISINTKTEERTLLTLELNTLLDIVRGDIGYIESVLTREQFEAMKYKVEE